MYSWNPWLTWDPEFAWVWSNNLENFQKSHHFPTLDGFAHEQVCSLLILYEKLNFGRLLGQMNQHRSVDDLVLWGVKAVRSACFLVDCFVKSFSLLNGLQTIHVRHGYVQNDQFHWLDWFQGWWTTAIKYLVIEQLFEHAEDLLSVWKADKPILKIAVLKHCYLEVVPDHKLVISVNNEALQIWLVKETCTSQFQVILNEPTETIVDAAVDCTVGVKLRSSELDSRALAFQ